MADLRVVAFIPAKPGSEDVVRAAVDTLGEASRGHQGCVDYEVFESASAPGTFVTVETWQSQDELDAHLRTEDIAAALGAVGEHLGGEIVDPPAPGRVTPGPVSPGPVRHLPRDERPACHFGRI